MQATHYAQALYKATTGADESVLEQAVPRLLDLLRERGHLRLFPKVVREYERIIARRATRAECLVRVAREHDASVFADRIARDRESLGAGTGPTRIILDDTAIGGYEVRSQGKRIDRTYKRTLTTLFETLKRAE